MLLLDVSQAPQYATLLQDARAHIQRGSKNALVDLMRPEGTYIENVFIPTREFAQPKTCSQGALEDAYSARIFITLAKGTNAMMANALMAIGGQIMQSATTEIVMAHCFMKSDKALGSFIGPEVNNTSWEKDENGDMICTVHQEYYRMFFHLPLPVEDPPFFNPMFVYKPFSSERFEQVPLGDAEAVKAWDKKYRQPLAICHTDYIQDRAPEDRAPQSRFAPVPLMMPLVTASTRFRLSNKGAGKHPDLTLLSATLQVCDEALCLSPKPALGGRCPLEKLQPVRSAVLSKEMPFNIMQAWQDEPSPAEVIRRSEGVLVAWSRWLIGGGTDQTAQTPSAQEGRQTHSPRLKREL